MKHKTIKDGDENITKSVELTQMELKVLYNECVSILDTLPQMMTFHDAAKKLKMAIKSEETCNCDTLFYGVNEVMGIQRLEPSPAMEKGIGIELYVQGIGKDSEDNMVLFIDDFLLNYLTSEYKLLKKSEKKISNF